MNVLGVDPGFANFGYAVVDVRKRRVLEADVVRTKKSPKKQQVFAADDNFRRAEEIADALIDIANRYEIHAVCAEAMSFPRSSSVAAKMAMSWGVLATLSKLLDLPFVFSTPQQIKLHTTGNRSASKEDVESAVTIVYGDTWVPDVASGLREHIFDAVAAVMSAESSPIFRMLR